MPFSFGSGVYFDGFGTPFGISVACLGIQLIKMCRILQVKLHLIHRQWAVVQTE